MVAAAEELRDGLRSATRVLHEQHRGWLEALAACLPLLRALGNLARQAEATQRAPLAETPLRAFARLPERLRLKQRAAMEALLAELRREKLPALREARDAVGARVAPLLALGGPHPNPAWADLLAGLLDAEALFHAVYLEARLLLLSLSYRDLAAVQAAPLAWERILQRGQRGGRVAGNRREEAFSLGASARPRTSLSWVPLGTPARVARCPHPGWLLLKGPRAWARHRPGLGWKSPGCPAEGLSDPRRSWLTSDTAWDLPSVALGRRKESAPEGSS